MKIIEVNHSIANRFDGYIEINKNLRKYPKLLQPILNHELAHTDKAFTWKDFKLDFFSNDKVPQWDLLKFALEYPRAFFQVLPIMFSRRKVKDEKTKKEKWVTDTIIDYNLLIMYGIFLTVFIVTILFGVKYL